MALKEGQISNIPPEFKRWALLLLMNRMSYLQKAIISLKGQNLLNSVSQPHQSRMFFLPLGVMSEGQRAAFPSDFPSGMLDAYYLLFLEYQKLGIHFFSSKFKCIF